mmetsp:Transcript_53522/g.160163  ORF Transcript_53522/g.160163 Transcript_53522/m.160163 type:complete len:724 (-) Transcript_53522:74-2245(-)
MRLRCQPRSVSNANGGRRKLSRRNRRSGRYSHGQGAERFRPTLLHDPATVDLFDYSLDEDDSNCDSTQEPELYSLVRRGNQCDWTAVSRRLDRIREGIEYLRQLPDENGNDSNEIDGKCNPTESFSGIVVGRGHPLHRQLILKDLRDLTWRHPYSGVTALHVAVCWQPPDQVLKLMIELALDVPKLLSPREDRTNPLWVRSKHGLTPLHLACSNVAEEHVARTLLQSCVPALPGLSQDEANALRAPATEWSRERKCGRSIYALLQTKEKGSTPLHCAAQSGASVEVMRLLIEAQPYAALVRDAEGLSPLDILCRGHERFLDRILVLIRVQRDVRHAKRRGEEFPPTAARNNTYFMSAGDADITADLPSELDHAVGPPADDDPSLEAYRRSFLREPLKDLWSKATLLIRTMAQLLDESNKDCSIDCRDDDDSVMGDVTQPARRYLTNATILHAVSIVATHRGGGIPLALFYLVTTAVPNQARGFLRYGRHIKELPIHSVIRSSFTSYSLSDPPPICHSVENHDSNRNQLIDGCGSNIISRPVTTTSQIASYGWRRNPGGVTYIPIQRFEAVDGEPTMLSSQHATPVDVVKALLDLNLESTRVLDRTGCTPLALAMRSYSRISSFLPWCKDLVASSAVVRELLKRDPACLGGLGLPDVLIARALSKMTRGGEILDLDGQKECLQSFIPGDLSTVFEIMRSKPDLVEGGEMHTSDEKSKRRQNLNE